MWLKHNFCSGFWTRDIYLILQKSLRKGSFAKNNLRLCRQSPLLCRQKQEQKNNFIVSTASLCRITAQVDNNIVPLFRVDVQLNSGKHEWEHTSHVNSIFWIKPKTLHDWMQMFSFAKHRWTLGLAYTSSLHICEHTQCIDYKHNRVYIHCPLFCPHTGLFYVIHYGLKPV